MKKLKKMFQGGKMTALPVVAMLIVALINIHM